MYTRIIQRMKPNGSQRYVRMALSGSGRCTRRPSWKIIWLLRRFLETGRADLLGGTM